MSANLATSKAARTAPSVQGTRQDLIALWVGIAVSFAATGLIWLLGPRLEIFPHLPDQGATWYYWKLPAPDFWARATAWGFYLTHQLLIWGIIFQAQRHRTRYGGSLSKYNYAALAVNGVFVALHFVQTHIWYDGLAQDVHIFTSQWSVIIMLVLIVMMENPRRGMFFGKKAPLSQRVVQFVRKYHGYIFSWGIIYTYWYHPMEATPGHLLGFLYTFLLLLQGSLFFTRIHLNKYWGFALETLVLIVMMENPRRGMFFGKKAPLSQRVVQFVRKYHGYIFSWGIIYTYWYHPMEATPGHLLGFLYTFLLLLQGSLFFTRIHLNKYWGFALETLVLIHGTIVAVLAANGLWQMFFFGFAGIVVVTTMYGLGLPRWARLTVLGLYLAAALYVYNQIGLARIHQITWIPITYYISIFVIAGLIGAGIWLVQRLGGGRAQQA